MQYKQKMVSTTKNGYLSSNNAKFITCAMLHIMLWIFDFDIKEKF